ncbi:hypothetical protein RHMOL_Rhmol06G0098300 [Rhododendron molle]|uniref:Uncharacterized protein n=1 Tax=Rhododendron molle TaxID=49168 RepID=A0ACC0NAX5_RHOML|nr:hypothetical protein RHMOL_Rhmol06G0098300 [Rhododendron molle]
MARQEVCDGRFVVAKDVNEGDEAARGAQLGVWFQRNEDTHEALVKSAALIIGNQPHYYLLNSCSFMEEATVRWLFTFKIILDPVVDWNKPPFFDEENEILQKFEKINLKYKIDADKFRQIQLYKLEDEFFQAGENDAN